MKTINKSELLDALNIVRPGIGTSLVVEQMDSFIFTQGRVVTYNDMLSISHPVTNIDFAGSVNGDQLYQFLQKSKSTEIATEQKDSQIIFNIGKSRAGLIVQQEIKIPLIDFEQEYEWIKLMPEQLDAIAYVLPCASTSMQEAKMGCVHINQQGFIEASDSYRLAHVTFKRKFKFPTMLIPARTLKQVLKLAPTEIAITDHWVLFRNATGTICAVRVFEENFPDTAAVLNVTGENIVLSSELKDAVDRASLFSTDNTVTVNVQQTQTIVKAEGATGWYEESLPCENHSTCSFMVDPELFLSILKSNDHCVLNDRFIMFAAEDRKIVSALKVMK